MAPSGTLPTKSPSPLMPFAHDWVGGDIHGLSAFAGTLYGYVPKVADVVNALDKKVGQIVSDAGWQGSAASAFTGNWEKVSAETNALGLVIIQTGSIVDQLAVDLAKIENALENAAGQAEAHGVQIGGSGQPPQVCYTNPTQEDWRVGYGSFYQQCRAAAEDARVQAAGALQKVSGVVTSAKSKAGRVGRRAEGRRGLDAHRLPGRPAGHAHRLLQPGGGQGGRADREGRPRPGRPGSPPRRPRGRRTAGSAPCPTTSSRR